MACLPIVAQAQSPVERLALSDPRNTSEVVGLILGKTTLPDVERIFATRGQREALASARLPRRLTPPPRWTVGGVVITPRIRVDETSQSPTLYFDGAERLVLVVDPAARGSTSRVEFEAQHPRARIAGRFRGTVAIEAPLEKCVTISALFQERDGSLQQLAYGYTCTAGASGTR
ncbi:MAG: hypothetical protein ABI587_08230 [Gemmatimonadales bacterium]